jgi:hypothetical protein
MQGPLAGGLGSGVTKATRVKPVSAIGTYAPTGNSGISTWDEPDWDCIFNFKAGTSGATPTQVWDCTVKLNFNPPNAEVWVDGEQIPSDPECYDEAVAALRQRILTEGSWAVAARDTLTDPENFEISPPGDAS